MGLPKRLCAVFVATLGLLAVFQSSSLVTLSYDLPPSQLNDYLVAGAETWHQWMENVGTAGITQTLRDLLEGARDSIIG